MKQTNNAIKFLMAQYRAIFKNAYFKGLTSAVLLTAGMAVAGGAQATSYTSLSQINALEDDFTVGSSGNFIIHASGAANDTVVMDGKGHDITINGSSDATEAGKEFVFGSANADEKLQIKNLGTLTIQKNATVTVTAGNSGTKGAGSAVDVYADTINVDNSVVNILQNTSGSSASHNAILRGKSITVTGKDAVINLGSLDNNRSSGGRAILGWRSDAKLVNDVPVSNNAGSDISFSNGATLNLLGRTGSGATAATDYNTEGSQVWGNSLTTNDSYVEVSGAGAQIWTHTNTFTNTNFHVANKAQLIIKPYEFRVLNDQNKAHDDHVYSYINGTTTFDGGNLIVEGNLHAAGTVVINDSVNLTAGNAALNTATGENNELYNGVLTIGMGESFTTDTDKAVDTQSTLKISSTKLNEFLKASNTNTEFKNAQGQTQTYVDKAGILSFGAGKVTLAFTDTTQVDMHQFNWVKTDMSTSGSSNAAVAGSIVYDASLAGKETSGDYAGLPVGVTVTATDMRIARALGTNGSGADEITFEADHMTLGSNKGDTSVADKWQGFESNASGLGVKELIAHDDLNLVDGLGSDYTLQDTVTLTRDYYEKDASGDYTTTAKAPGLIKGDNLVIGGDDEGTLSITGGAWQNDARQSLTIASGSLSINASAHDRNGDGSITDGDALKDGLDYHGNNTNRNYYTNGNPSSLTWNGAFVINGGDASKATIAVTGAQGADATLDLRNASVTWGSGAVTLSGISVDTSKTDPEASAGEGILYITGNQFNSFLGSGDVGAGNVPAPTATLLNIDTDGVLFVDGPVTGDINFDEFTNETTADTAGKVNFMSGAGSGAGTLYINGGISLVTGDADTNTNGESLDIGAGTIDAQTIAINNNGVASDDRGNVEVDKVTVAQGTLEVSSSLTSNNATVEFGEGSSGAKLVLDTDGGVNSAGSVTSNLVFNGSSSSLEVDEGSWALAAGKDITLNDGASFVVGTDNYDVRGIKASLAADNLEITDAGTNQIYDGSSATFNTLQAGTATFYVDGTLTVLGRSDMMAP